MFLSDVNNYVRKIIQTTSGPHDLNVIVVDHLKRMGSLDYDIVKLVTHEFCPYRVLADIRLAGLFFDEKKFVAAIDDNTDYIFNRVLLDRRIQGYPIAFYLSNPTIATMISIAYGFPLVSQEDEWKLVW